MESHYSNTKDNLLFAKLPWRFEPGALQLELERFQADNWLPHVNRANYGGSWAVLPLRCLAEHAQAHPILQGFAIETGDAWCNLPALTQAPAMLGIIERLRCPVGAVRLMRLQAGAHIKPHRDKGLSLEYGEARLHLPITTDPKVEFVVGGRRVPMPAGELWYINADAEHSVNNKSPGDRVNLVIDCKVNDWLRELIRGAEVKWPC
ncbi:aspartyl/asparaginyl beta-hydroxylase domain-containing protein [Shewanella sp. AS16]|uniref:aspartyl/asparaginyl beta-hydroxylase domain-containing protein n=1 Tax=Shewanella sp. AS16 TaxID=2907625 RepID=UPI001F326E3A|nr:aspartyl/asparaginyl beta-hydroxylase domain-containing protein [Shewanella sp. AS16]MCE9685538.1 aspartyl/asparaginyl beta-hydroxylase domain-containing protein [Shewanella sp. AS16]